MRRVISTSSRLCAVAVARGNHSKAAASTSAAGGPPAATTSPTTTQRLGSAISASEVAKASGVPVSLLQKAKNPRLTAYTEMNLAASRFAPLIATIDNSADYNAVERAVAQRYRGDAAKLTPVPGALKKFTQTNWTDMASLITFYEETMYPIRMKHYEYKDYELTSFHIKDILKRGLSAFKQDFLDAQKTEQTKVKAQMKTCQDFIAAAVSDAFDTKVCNDLVNILRIGGQRHAHSHRMALKVLEDMNTMRIPFDAATMEIMQTAVFNDGPFDNSPLLFEVIEYPERGEVSVSKASLEDISGDILKLISNRHQTPLDDGKLLQSTETHPNLQRSPE